MSVLGMRSSLFSLWPVVESYLIVVLPAMLCGINVCFKFQSLLPHSEYIRLVKSQILADFFGF
jgi:hypothetical protein